MNFSYCPNVQISRWQVASDAYALKHRHAAIYMNCLARNITRFS
jgi:hypothetical protein